jgi:hypothetical protein
MKLKDIVLAAALTASSALSGCDQPTEVINNNPTECDKLRMDFKSKVEKFGGWNEMYSKCQDNMKLFLDIADIKKTLSTKCDIVMDNSAYDSIFKGLEYQLSNYGCISQPEKK